jgi:general secretion pathway protein C
MSAALFIWLGVGLLLGYGVLQGWGRRELLPPAPLPAPAPLVVDSAMVGRALGAVAAPTAVVAPVTAAVPTRYTLVGVMAVGRDGQGGVALIATDGQRAKPYRVGATVDGRWQVQSVSARAAVLQPLPSVVHTDSQGAMHLQLPAPPALPSQASAVPSTGPNPGLTPTQ